MITEQDIVERLRNHVNHRNGPSLLNGAWQMMLDAADHAIRDHALSSNQYSPKENERG
jgi:hypothetical protein